MNAREEEISNIKIENEKEILFCQEEYIKSKIDYIEANEVLTWKIGKATIVSVLIMLGYVSVNSLGGYSLIVLFPFFLMLLLVGFPFSMAFGTGKLARFIFKPLFYNNLKKVELAEIQMLNKKKEFKEVLFSNKTKSFIFELYLFLEERMKDWKMILDNHGNPSNTIVLFGLLKKVIQEYDNPSEDSFEKIAKNMKEIRGKLVELSKEIERENKTNKAIKEFLKEYLNKELKEEIIKNNEILFKKNKYDL